MRVTPGGGIVIVVMIVRMAVMMVVAVIVLVVIVMRMTMSVVVMRMIVRVMLVIMPMIMVRMVMVMIMTMIVVMMVVLVRGRRRRSPDRLGLVQRTRLANERPALHPQKPQPNDDDQRVAQRLDHVDRHLHRRCGRIQHRGRDPDQHHRDQSLKNGGGKGEHNAAFPRLLVGDEIGRDHRLAVTGTGRMKHAIRER